MEQTPFLEKIHDVEKHTKAFEVSLRTAFLKKNPNNHISIQRVNNECENLKRKVRDLLSVHTMQTWELFKRDSVVTSAQSLIQKFENVKDRGIPLVWDVLYLYGSAHLFKNK